MRALLGIIVTAVVISACSAPSGDPIVDGFPIGPVVKSCDWTEPDPGCITTIDIAVKELDAISPGHPKPREAVVHDIGSTGGTPNPGIAVLQSVGRLQVVVFDFAGGQKDAIGVACRAAGCQAIAHL